MDAARPPHRIMLVREWDSQSGSGCCGRLDGGRFVGPAPDDPIADRPASPCDAGPAGSVGHRRPLMETMGGIYRALRRELPRDTADITVVDPRNMVWLIPAIIADGRRRGLTGGQVWRQVTAGVRNGAIVVDGRALLARDYATEDDAVTAVIRALATTS